MDSPVIASSSLFCRLPITTVIDTIVSSVILLTLVFSHHELMGKPTTSQSGHNNMNTTSSSLVNVHSHDVPGNTASWVVCISITYLLLVRLLRYRTSTKIQNISNKKYTSRKSYTSMTLDDAWSIIVTLSSTEFPSTFSISVFFALFKVN